MKTLLFSFYHDLVEIAKKNNLCIILRNNDGIYSIYNAYGPTTVIKKILQVNMHRVKGFLL